MNRLSDFKLRGAQTTARPKRAVHPAVAATSPIRPPGVSSQPHAPCVALVPDGGPCWSRLSTTVMRSLDIFIALLALVVLAPLMLVIALLIRVTSKGPILFRQTRVGYLGRPFVMMKFRSMYAECDDKVHRDFVIRMLSEEEGARGAPDGAFKLAGDPRITPIGHILRRTSLDELPQLFNVLRGQMSLVGPRPSLPWEVGLYQEHHHLRFHVKPGLTGLWQVRGRSLVTMQQALDLDVVYVYQRSLRLNLWILLMTLPVVLRGDGAR
jgi:lipopolysaccharide/colanic/teichoic acid biosynthesis glycosyltransferase